MLGGREPAAQPLPLAPYRSAKDSPEVVLRDFETLLSTHAHRVRVLERQLRAAGIEPAPTPRGRDLLLAADVLEGKVPPLNTLELRQLATMIRGLATWVE